MAADLLSRQINIAYKHKNGTVCSPEQLCRKCAPQNDVSCTSVRVTLLVGVLQFSEHVNYGDKHVTRSTHGRDCCAPIIYSSVERTPTDAEDTASSRFSNKTQTGQQALKNPVCQRKVTVADGGTEWSRDCWNHAGPLAESAAVGMRGTVHEPHALPSVRMKPASQQTRVVAAAVERYQPV